MEINVPRYITFTLKNFKKGNKFTVLILNNNGDIAQFGRALEWHSRGQRFDPAYLHERLLLLILFI